MDLEEWGVRTVREERQAAKDRAGLGKEGRHASLKSRTTPCILAAAGVRAVKTLGNRAEPVVMAAAVMEEISMELLRKGPPVQHFTVAVAAGCPAIQAVRADGERDIRASASSETTGR